MSGDGPAFGAITTPQSSWPSPSNEHVGKRRKVLGEVASPQLANAPKESQMVESDNALGEAQGDSLVVDRRVWAERGRGKRTPAITSPLSFDLTGVRFQRRARLARGPPNPSALSTYHPTGRSGMHKPPRSKGLALTAHIGTYALLGSWDCTEFGIVS